MQRQQEIKRWLAKIFPGIQINLFAASADASFRRYFRFALADGTTRVVMDAPPDKEDVQPWLAIQTQLLNAGLHVPAVEAQDLTHGFLLISDLGRVTYLEQINTAPAHANGLYRDALSSVVTMQTLPQAAALPLYDEALLRREMALFPEWFLGKHHGLVLSTDEKIALDTLFTRIVRQNLNEPQVFVHRDFHSRNLMFIADQHNAKDQRVNPGIIDFQDAVWGPMSYDLVSLLKDAYVDWDEAQTLDWLIRYWQQARLAGLPVRGDFADFFADYEWMGIQRHLKVLGIFARLFHRDGKAGYLNDLPRVKNYVRKACERYNELTPLRRLLDRADNNGAPATPTVGYTF